MLRAKERGEVQDPLAFATRVRGAVTDIVRKQVELGVDVVDDGEMGKPGFIHYTNDRLAGFEVIDEVFGSPWRNSREVKAFPEFYEWFGRIYPSPSAGARHMACTGPIAYKGTHIQADIANLKAALKGRAVEDTFMPSISPTSVEDWQRNRYYKTQEEFLLPSPTDARGVEGDRRRGLHPADRRPAHLHLPRHRRGQGTADVRKSAEVRIEALNDALRDLPRDRVRWHSCYGINIGPREHDIELKASSTSCCASAPARTRSKPQTRATSTSGGWGGRPAPRGHAT